MDLKWGLWPVDELRLAVRHGIHTPAWRALGEEARQLGHWLAARAEVSVAQAAVFLRRPEHEVEVLLSRLHVQGLVARVERSGAQLFHLHPPVRELAQHASTEAPSAEGIRAGLVSGMSRSLALKTVSLTLDYLTSVLMARWLGSRGFGLYSLTMTWGSLLAYGVSLGLPVGLERFLPTYRDSEDWARARGLIRRSVQLTLLTGGVLIALAAVVLALTRELSPPEKIAIALGVAFAPLRGITDVLSGSLQAFKRWIAAFFPEAVFMPVVLLLTLVVMHASLPEFRPAEVVLATWIVQMLAIILLFLFLIRGVPAAYRAAAPRYETREWLGTSVPLVLMAFFLVIVNRADLLLVGAFLGREPAGIYTAVLSTSEALAIFVRVGVLVSTPDIAPYFVKHDRAALQNLMTWTARFCFIPALAGAIGLALFGREILGWFGPGFEVGYPALLICIVEELIRAGLGVPGRLLVIAGERMAVARSLIGGALVDLILLVLLVHPFGLVGAAIAGGMATLTTQVYLAYETRRQLHVDTTVFAPTVPMGSAA